VTSRLTVYGDLLNHLLSHSDWIQILIRKACFSYAEIKFTFVFLNVCVLCISFRIPELLARSRQLIRKHYESLKIFYIVDISTLQYSLSFKISESLEKL
jgi:hypothetical protein